MYILKKHVHIGTSRFSHVMVLVRKLYLLAEHTGFSVPIKHILGIHNPVADALSCLQVGKFN